MKKYIAMITASLLIAAVFTSCSGKIKGTTEVLDNNDPIAAVTNDEGNLARDEKGNLVVAVTDGNGKAVKGENGKQETTVVALSHAVTLGNRIETGTFSVAVPDGWVAGSSYSTVVVDSDDENKTKKVVFYTSTDKDAETYEDPGFALLNLVVTNDQVTVNSKVTDTVTVAGIEAERTRFEVTSEKIEYKVINYYSFDGPNASYGVICYSKDASTANSVFEEVINSMIVY